MGSLFKIRQFGRLTARVVETENVSIVTEETRKEGKGRRQMFKRLYRVLWSYQSVFCEMAHAASGHSPGREGG